MSDWPTCSRCGRDARPDEMTPAPDLPRGWTHGAWTGSEVEVVCPNCEYAEWHPHCTSWLDEYGYGRRVGWRDENGEEVVAPEIAAMPREEWHTGAWAPCDSLDLSVSWVDQADWPKAWRCPQCGGTDFEGVHRDYMLSGLKGAGFTVELNEDD